MKESFTGVETKVRYIFRVSTTIVVILLSFLVIACSVDWIFEKTVTTQGISLPLFVIGIGAILISGVSGLGGFMAGSHREIRNPLVNYTIEMESRTGGPYRPSAYFQIVTAGAGLLASLLSIVLPLFF